MDGADHDRVEYELQRQRLLLHPVFLIIAYSLLLTLTAGLLAFTGWHRHTLLIFLLPLLLAADSHPRRLYLGMAALLSLAVAWLTWFNLGDLLTTALTLLWVLVIGVGLGELVILLNKHWRRSASELRSNQRFLSRLNDVTHTVLEETEQQPMLQTLADRLGDLFHADGCFITFYNEEQRAILPAAAYGPLRESYPHFKAVSDGPTLTQSVLDAGEVLVIEDVFNTPYLHPDIAHQFPARSAIALPLIAGGKKLGAALVTYDTARQFNTVEIERAGMVAGQISLAVYKGQLLESERRQRREIETIFRAFTAITAEIDLTKVLTLILEQLERVIPYDSAAVFLAEGDQMEILAVGGEADRQQLIGMKVPSDNGLFHEISSTKQPLIIPDAQQDPRFMGWGGTSYVRGWMGLPLIAAGEIIGQLTVDSRQVDAFTRQDARLVMTFAREASIAIRHAQLYQQAVQTAERLSILYEANREITAALEPRELYQAIHRAAERIMPTESFVISILDTSVQEIEVVYMVDNHGASPRQRIPAGQGLSGYIISTGKSVYIKNTQDGMDIPVLQSGDPNPILSFLAVPMRRQDGSAFGMVSAQSYQLNAYTAADLEVLELLASQASIALENTRLFAELQTLAITDPLTGIYNRRYFFNIARREFDRSHRYGHPLSIIMLDIDHFKRVNDQHGHGVGDVVLQAAAQRCLRSVREVDILARYGGEEFVALITETGLAQAQIVAERFRSAIAGEPILVNGISVSITASIGVSSLDDECADLDCLLMRADQALYNAKEAGRDVVQLG
jgi:diguanylate cyclase (GGDEF)-like protein